METLEELLKLPNGENLNEVNICPTIDVMGEEFELYLKDSNTMTVSKWVCDPAKRNRLFWANNRPVLAREIHYGYEDINWSAGIGWKNYYIPQPLNDRKDGFAYPGLPRHCLILEFGGIGSQTGNMQSGDRGYKVTDVFAFVNDDKYDDNVGSFTVYITAYSQV